MPYLVTVFTRILNFIFIIIIAIGSLIPHSDYTQLLKIKELSKHYQFHKSEAKLGGTDFDLCDFLFLHFIKGDEHHDENSDHDNLPFKQFTSGSNFYLLSSMRSLIWNDPVHNTNNSIEYWAFFVEDEFLESVFQPPIV